MEKKVATVVLLFMSTVMAFAQGPFPAGGFPGGSRRGGFSQEPGKLYTLSVGKVTMTIDENGGKVRSYKYGDQEIISQSQMPNAWGSTFWTSPQKEWNWPPVSEFDSAPYVITEKDGKLIMASRISTKLPMRIVKEFFADETDGCIVANYYIVNESKETRKVAPWEITRVPSEGVVFFDCPVDNIEAASGELIIFDSAYGLSWYKFDERPANRKINADGQGWLAYSNNGLLMVKKFDNITPAQPAPGEAEIQVYVNAGSTYTELESQGEYKTLKPGEALRWTVRWYLVPQSNGLEPSKALAKQVKKIVK